MRSVTCAPEVLLLGIVLTIIDALTPTGGTLLELKTSAQLVAEVGQTLPCLRFGIGVVR